MLPILEIEQLSKQYRLGYIGTGSFIQDFNRWFHRIRGKENPYLKIGEENDPTKAASSDYVWALRDINFKVNAGEVLGIVGGNGAGKSTLLKILSRVTGPTTGTVTVRGKIASLLEVGTGFNGELTGRENIYLNGAILGMSRQEITKKLDEIIDFSGCVKYIDTPVKRYSSGMYVRLAFAVAAYLEPEILIVDEVLAVGDAEFQKKAIGKIDEVSRDQGRTILFVSHNMSSVERICTRGIFLERGRITLTGSIDTIISHYAKYSKAERLISKHSVGGIHVTDLQFFNAAEESVQNLHTLEYIKIIMKCKAEMSFSKVSFAVCFNDIYDKRVLSLWTSLNGTTYDVQQGTFKIEFIVPSFKLIPGEYTIVTYIGQNQIEIEQINNFSTVIVNHNPIYGTVTPLSIHGNYIEQFSTQYLT